MGMLGQAHLSTENDQISFLTYDILLQHTRPPALQPGRTSETGLSARRPPRWPLLPRPSRQPLQGWCTAPAAPAAPPLPLGRDAPSGAPPGGSDTHQ